MKPPSKRKLLSYSRATLVCRELRYQMEDKGHIDPTRLKSLMVKN